MVPVRSELIEQLGALDLRLTTATARYLDTLPTSGNELGRGFRDVEFEQRVLELTQKFGIGAQFGGKYFCHDVRVIRLPRHGASNPVGIAVSCSADRQARAPRRRRASSASPKASSSPVDGSGVCPPSTKSLRKSSPSGLAAAPVNAKASSVLSSAEEDDRGRTMASAAKKGLRLPLVYNTGGYDSLEALALLDGVIDVYMPDMKYGDPELAHRYSHVRDYVAFNRKAVREMHRQVGDLVVDERGVAKRGLLVRHLVMPGQEDEAAAIFRWLASEVSPDTYVNIMGQYRPAYQTGARTRDGKPKYADIDRQPTMAEMSAARAAARRAGLSRFDRRT